MTLQQLKARRNEILAIAARYGIENVRVFGSVARGTQTADSDIDLLVDAPPGTGLKIGGFVFEVQQLLGPQVEIQTEGSIHEEILPMVLKEAQAL